MSGFDSDQNLYHFELTLPDGIRFKTLTAVTEAFRCMIRSPIFRERFAGRCDFVDIVYRRSRYAESNPHKQLIALPKWAWCSKYLIHETAHQLPPFEDNWHGDAFLERYAWLWKHFHPEPYHFERILARRRHK